MNTYYVSTRACSSRKSFHWQERFLSPSEYILYTSSSALTCTSVIILLHFLRLWKLAPEATSHKKASFTSVQMQIFWHLSGCDLSSHRSFREAYEPKTQRHCLFFLHFGTNPLKPTEMSLMWNRLPITEQIGLNVTGYRVTDVGHS